MWKSVLVNKLRGLIMKLTKRGKRVRAVFILIWQVASNLWWVGTDSAQAEFLGWCWGSMNECVVL